ncbi:pyridoxamine 5'-phosphate oxidase family protein [Actinokineospora sp. UTMC 2448]|uniref:pyridoxamine 5'-phosphate oxidase family protein n=1 Tax=Actinokineospora sp. UTMC 2448 TaxID=2268449 RepID=UPI0021648CD2|nr:PPOX class F420-dependent oxidoreductase [Actinokineospora sp. UTMC 2448]
MWQPDAEFLAFWTERHLCTLTTRRLDGSPHVVPVGATFDADARLVRVITSRGSWKVRNVVADPVVAVCQLDGRRWSTVEGVATVRDDAVAVGEAVRRYAERYRQPRPNPERVVIEIAVGRVMGTVKGVRDLR